MVLETATRALREQSSAILIAGLAEYVASQRGGAVDSRDLMVGLAPLHDCARRLGLDPVEIFDEIATDEREPLATTVTDFARRSDITPEAFGFAVDQGPDGPVYRWT